MSFLKKAEEKLLNIKSEIFQATKSVESRTERTVLEIVHDLARLVYDLLACGCCCKECSGHDNSSNSGNNGSGGNTVNPGQPGTNPGTNPGNNGTNTGGNTNHTVDPNGPILIPNLPKPNNPDSDGKPVTPKPIQQNVISFDNGNGTTNLPGGAKIPSNKVPSNNQNNPGTTPNSDKKPVPALVVSKPDTSASKVITKDDYNVEKPITPVNPSKSSS